MTVIARDGVAADHLVYAWPFPIGPECEVSCSEDEQVVMCPSYLVGDRLGPGRHRWRTPDPMRPVAAFFVLTSPVEAPFDMTTSFMLPTTGQFVRLRASGSVQVRCADPGLLIAQFVGLPFDSVNDGILRSVSRSVERMLARLLTRRVVMASTPMAVTDPQMLRSIVEELVAYNPTAGAVFGVELMRMGHMTIVADDGSTPYIQLPAQNIDWSDSMVRQRAQPPPIPPNGNHRANRPTDVPPPVKPRADVPLLETVRGVPPPGVRRAQSVPPGYGGAAPEDAPQPSPRSSDPNLPKLARSDSQPSPEGLAAASGEINIPAKRAAQAIEVPRSPDEITQPNLRTPVPGSMRVQTTEPAPPPSSDEPRGAILGIGVGHIGSGSVAGEIPSKVAPGARVLVPGPNGLMQSATVRQLLSGYYELEVGSSGETIWVPINGVVPE